jgi:flavin reductase (DIM6/NTAB) family NADH-FMN oxidoreductase RutF
MVASWVVKVSFKPPGISVAVAKDRAIEFLLHVGNRFILNVLEAGDYQKLMKHFLKRFALSADRFANVKTYAATKGSPILADGLACMEREVKSRMELAIAGRFTPLWMSVAFLNPIS